MSIKGRDFFKQQSGLDLQSSTDPEIPRCDGEDCVARANPAWSDGTRTYCSLCAPPSLKTPEKFKDATDA